MGGGRVQGVKTPRAPRFFMDISGGERHIRTAARTGYDRMTAQNWPTSIGAMTLFCEDLAASKAFYAAFLGAEPIWGDEVSSVFRAGETMINLLQVVAVAELINPSPMAPPGVRAVYTLSVPDVDLEAERLRAAGLALLNGPMDRPWGIRTVSLQDPSCHVWELAAPLQRKTDRT